MVLDSTHTQLTFLKHLKLSVCEALSFPLNHSLSHVCPYARLSVIVLQGVGSVRWPQSVRHRNIHGYMIFVHNALHYRVAPCFLWRLLRSLIVHNPTPTPQWHPTIFPSHPPILTSRIPLRIYLIVSNSICHVNLLASTCLACHVESHGCNILHDFK